MKKNILVVSTGSNFSGGAELQLNKILQNISKYEIHLFSFAKSDRDLAAYSILKKKKNLYFYSINFKKPFKLIKNLKKILKIIEESKNKVTILGWLAKGNLIGLFLGMLKPFQTKLFLCHRSKFTLYQSLKSQILLYISLIIYFIYPKKIIHIANSPIIYSSKIIRFLLKSKPICIKNCFEFNKKQNIKKLFLKESDPIQLTIVGRFSREKGYELLFKSLSKVSFNYKLLCIGKGCSLRNQKFKNLCAKYKVKVKACEKVKNINKIYLGTDYLVSSSFSESFPNVVVESLLAGTPVISTPTGCFLNILKEFNLVSESFRSYDFSIVLNDAYLLRKNQKKYQSICKKLRRKIIKEVSTPIQAAKNYERVFLINNFLIEPKRN